MKKMFLIVLFVSIRFGSPAQVRVGVRVGATVTDVNISDRLSGTRDLFWSDFDPNGRMSYSAGVTVDYPLVEDLLSLRTTLEFARKGFRIDPELLRKKYDEIESIRGDWTAAYRYLQLPVDVVYHFGAFNVNAGPYLAYGLGGTEVMNLSGVNDDGSTFEYNDVYTLTPVFGEAPGLPDDNGHSMLIHYFNTLDFGFNIGFGYRIKNVLINVQYQQGLTNITPAFQGDSGFDPSQLDMRHNVIGLQLTYFFNFGKKTLVSTPTE